MASKEKQIEEMARSLCLLKQDSCDNCDMKESCLMRNCAKCFYTAGYRKASEVAREIIVAADETINTICIMTGIEIVAVGGKYLELRKKYTEESE